MEKQVYTVKIEFIPGSKFQEDIFVEHLQAILTALNIHFSTNNKKNKIKITWVKKESTK